MIVVLSGEGPSDLGQCDNAQGQCRIPEFVYGPMTVLVDKALEERLHYSLLSDTPDRYIFVSEKRLEELETQRKNENGKFVFSGKKQGKETGYYRINAWMLGLEALRLEQEENDSAIAILFRDTDGTRSTVKGLWEQKLQSMRAGFDLSGISARGVPMLPKPKSEAWLLCAAKAHPYQHCAILEELSGNDDSPDSAKSKLDDALGGHATTADQVNWLNEHGFDHAAVAHQMPSFREFMDGLNVAVNAVQANAA